jgi:hypothetical protein
MVHKQVITSESSENTCQKCEKEGKSSFVTAVVISASVHRSSTKTSMSGTCLHSGSMGSESEGPSSKSDGVDARTVEE